MAISLEQLSRKIGDKRRDIAKLNESLQEGITAFDTKQEEHDKLGAELDGKEPTDEQSAKLASLKTELRDLRLANVKKADEVNAAKSELAELESDLKMRQASNETEDWLSQSATNNSLGGDGGSLAGGSASSQGAGGLSSGVRVLAPTAEQLDHDLGVALQCYMLSSLQNFRTSPGELAANHFHNERVANASMSAGEHTAGGSWIQGVYLDRFIELLRPRSVVRRMGVESVPLDDGSLTMAKETAGPSGRYLGENEVADTEVLQTGDIKLVAKELVCIVPATEKLIRSPSAQAAQRIRNSILRGAGQTEDLYFLRGSASSAGPTGMRYLAAAANIIAANATINLANVTNDLGKLELALLNGNVVMEMPAWIMAPRSLVYLTDLRDGNGNLAWPTLQGERPVLRGKPVYTTTQIPINLGGGTDESEIILAEASHLIIGEVPRLSLESSNTAAYSDGGTVKAAFSERKVITRLVMENDFNTLQDKAIAVLTGVKWGA